MKGTVQTEQRPARQSRPEREYVSPEVNIYETKEGYVLEAEMPGVSKDGLEITLEGNEITIIGHRQNEVVAGTPLFRERTLADYPDFRYWRSENAIFGLGGGISA
jgi:HSP20 family molecular chaperone IbpA